MTIKNEKEYEEFEARMEQLIQRGTELGDMELLSEQEKAEHRLALKGSLYDDLEINVAEVFEGMLPWQQ